MNLVWLKRDLRLSDHRPLVEACARGQVTVLYCYEPELYQSEDFHPSHLEFVNQSLAEMRRELRRRGSDLVVRCGGLPEVFNQLHQEQPIEAIFAHEETGNMLTYQRDLRVRAWCREQGVRLHEYPQNGVVRRLQSRDGWARRWAQRMGEKRLEAPPTVPCAGLAPGTLLEPRELGLEPSSKTLQPGGEKAAKEVLGSFLNRRGRRYHKELSSPVTAFESCSRLSPYLTWGNLSMKQVASLTQERMGKVDSTWRRALKAFHGRLHWHCHFMQKLEDEPEIEFHNMNRGYDGMREEEFSQEHFQAWKDGRTGYPMVDACIRCLRETSWINFRMRAMVVSFASYHLWLHWRPVSQFLAQHFLDYEPGIHYSQIQMQSGVTGINAPRIYSPIKQVKDQDPEGLFIRRYLPELEGVPAEHLAEPHLMSPAEQSRYGCRIGRDYPVPIVEHKVAYGQARKRIYEWRKKPECRRLAGLVLEKHGSRRGN